MSWDKKLDRRRFLMTSGATILLPFFESLYSAEAIAAAGDPKRFVAMYMPNGTFNIDNDGAYWQPRQSGALVKSNLPAISHPSANNFGDFSTVRGIYNARMPADHAGSISSFLVGSGYQDTETCALANE